MNKKEANKILEQRIKDYEPIKELRKFIDDSEEKHKQTMYYLRYILWTMEEEYQKKCQYILSLRRRNDKKENSNERS